MKLLIFAHIPPPYHGQSAAVNRLLVHLGGDRRKVKFRHDPVNRYGIECYHVNARLSKTLEDVGEFQFRKFDQILFYCLQAIWCRFRYGVKTMYYVPAPGKAVAVYRDWIVMFFCRPFFDKIIFHWEGGGLAKWLETSVPHKIRSITYRLMGNVDLSIVLAEFGRGDAEKLLPCRIAVINNGFEDPCPQFNDAVLPARRARAAMLKTFLFRNAAPPDPKDAVINILYVATCARDKGLFDAVEGVRLANQASRDRNLPLRFRFVIGGTFSSKVEEAEMRQYILHHSLRDTVTLAGFVFGESKSEAFRNADIFCFPTYYPAEVQPTCVAEALAFGLPVITTRWRAVPEMLPENYPGLVDIKSPHQIAEKLLFLCASDLGGFSREIYLRRFALERHMAAMSEVILDMEDMGAKDA